MTFLGTQMKRVTGSIGLNQGIATILEVVRN
jgi:hypothetical protein